MIKIYYVQIWKCHIETHAYERLIDKNFKNSKPSLFYSELYLINPTSSSQNVALWTVLHASLIQENYPVNGISTFFVMFWWDLMTVYMFDVRDRGAKGSTLVLLTHFLTRYYNHMIHKSLHRDASQESGPNSHLPDL